MRRYFAAGLFLCALMASAVVPKTAEAKYAPVVTCDRQGCRDATEHSAARPRAYKQRAYKAGRKARSRAAGQSSLVSIQCGRSTIRVARTAAVQFEGFCRDFYAVYKFKVVGGYAYRGGSCHTASKHPCGGAIDIEQTCRSRGPGHCLPGSFPVAASERIARNWGLKPGSEWKSRDVGHFETKGSLAGNGWPTSKLAQVAKAVVVAVTPDEPEPKHPLLGSYQLASAMPQSEDYIGAVPHDFTPVPSLDKRVMTTMAYYVYNEYQPGPRPVDVLRARLSGIPVGTSREEIRRAARLFGLPERMLMSFAKIESDFDCRNRTGKYKGLFQLSDYEFNRYGSGDIWNCRDNAIASAHKFLVEGAFFEHATGHWPTFADLYMIHQQGLGGASEHASRPDRLAWQSMCASEEGKQKGPRWCRLAIWGNVPANLKREFGSVETLTSGTFAGMWRARVERFASLDLDQVSASGAKKTHAVKKRKRYVHRKKHRAKRIYVAHVQ